MGIAHGAMAAAASAADTGMDVGSDPIPTVIAPPTAEQHGSPILLHIRQSAPDMAVSYSQN